MTLNKKVKLINPARLRESFKKANIKKTDLEDSILEDTLISDFNPKGSLTVLEKDNKIQKYKLDLHKPKTSRSILAYDESIQKFNMLQGNLIFTSHALVETELDDYDYSCQVTAYFATRASDYKDLEIAIISDTPEEEVKIRYLEDRFEFLTSNTPKNSILFVDGPLIGSQSSSKNVKLVIELMKDDIIPIFYVKNSYSSLVIDHLGGEIKKKYNTDLDFANRFLSNGERTSYFLYQDLVNKDNNKVFAYVKCYNRVPQRFEMHYETYKKYQKEVEEITSMVNFYSILQGDLDNPQLRPVAIAERFARESLKYFSPNQLILITGLDETMNTMRGFG